MRLACLFTRMGEGHLKMCSPSPGSGAPPGVDVSMSSVSGTVKQIHTKCMAASGASGVRVMAESMARSAGMVQGGFCVQEKRIKR